MIPIVKTKVLKEDIELLKKAGLDKSGIIELRAIRIENDRTYRDERVDPNGVVISADEKLGNSFDLEDEKVTLATVAIPGTSVIKGYWKNGLNVHEIKRLSERYSLPNFYRGDDKESDTLFEVHDGMVLDLDNLVDHCKYNVLKQNPSIQADKSACSEYAPFYWVVRADLKKQQQDRILAKKEIYNLVFGPEAMNARDKCLCWEYVQYMQNTPHKIDDTEEDYVWALEDAVTDTNKVLVIKDFVKAFNKPNGKDLLYLKRLEHLGDVFTRSLGGAEREYYVKTVQGETRVAGSLSEMLTYIKHSRNTELYRKAEMYSPFKEAEIFFTETMSSQIDDALGIAERVYDDAEDVFTEDFGDAEVETVDYEPISSYTPAKLAREKADVLDKLILSAKTECVITEEEFDHYNSIKSITSKRAFIKLKFNIN